MKNRTIKFRAWNKNTKEMCWVYEWNPTNMIVRAIRKNAKPYRLPHGDNHSVLMQFTGLKDKNGAEIYEADWLQEDDGRKYFIVWAEDEARFELENFEDHTLRHIKDVRVMQVVGNDYEK